jgi:hypothetical protein
MGPGLEGGGAVVSVLCSVPPRLFLFNSVNMQFISAALVLSPVSFAFSVFIPAPFLSLMNA